MKIMVFSCTPPSLPLSVDLAYSVDWTCIVSASRVKKDVDGSPCLRLCSWMRAGDMMTRNRIWRGEVKYSEYSGSGSTELDQTIKGRTILHCPVPGPSTNGNATSTFRCTPIFSESKSRRISNSLADAWQWNGGSLEETVRHQVLTQPCVGPLSILANELE